MAEGGVRTSVRKRGLSGKETAKKRSHGISEGFRCCFTRCDELISPSDSRVEVKSHVNVESRMKLFVVWSDNGEAIFHRKCWENILRNSRVRNTKNATIHLSNKEKSMVKEANKTVEYHDSDEKIVESCIRIASLIIEAKHCVAFTGAGISTSAGIGE